MCRLHSFTARRMSPTELKDFAATVLKTLLRLVRPLGIAVDSSRSGDLGEVSDDFPGGTPQDARDYAQVSCMVPGRGGLAMKEKEVHFAGCLRHACAVGVL